MELTEESRFNSEDFLQCFLDVSQLVIELVRAKRRNIVVTPCMAADEVSSVVASDQVFRLIVDAIPVVSVDEESRFRVVVGENLFDFLSVRVLFTTRRISSHFTQEVEPHEIVTYRSVIESESELTLILTSRDNSVRRAFLERSFFGFRQLECPFCEVEITSVESVETSGSSYHRGKGGGSEEGCESERAHVDRVQVTEAGGLVER